jgi:hypothetical protein
MPANKYYGGVGQTTEDLFRTGIKPRTPHAMAPAVAVTARGMISEIKKNGNNQQKD